MCLIGVVLSEDPLNYDARWKCENYPENCSFEPVSSKAILELELASDEEIMLGPKRNIENGKEGILTKIHFK